MPAKRTTAKAKSKKPITKVRDLSVTAKELGQKGARVTGGARNITIT